MSGHSHAQHCPPGRFAVVAVVGLTLYLTGLAPLRRLLRRLTGLIPALHLHQGGRPGVADGPPGGPHPDGVPRGGPPGAAPPGAPGGPPDIFGVDGGVPAPGGAAPGRGAAPGGPPPNPAEGGFVRELQALVIGFFTSLLPGAPALGRADVCVWPSAHQESRAVYSVIQRL